MITNPVAFVCMPFASVKRPALGISMLQAMLKKNQINSDIYYFNLDLAAQTGEKNYTWISEHSPTPAMAGEWVFSGALFGPDRTGNEAYLSEIIANKYEADFSRLRLIALFSLKQKAPSFINACFEHTNWSQYKIVGFTSSYQQNCASLALAKKIKEQYPEVCIVFGGANCEAEMGIQLSRTFPFIDYVCSGEGEIAFSALVQYLLAGTEPPEIDGIIARKNGATVVPAKIVCAVTKLDELPYADYTAFYTRKNQLPALLDLQTVIPFETSRGCWWGELHHCTFCGLNGLSMGFRSKSGDRAIRELLYLAEHYGSRFQVVDNILDNAYFKTFLPELARLKTGAGLFYEVKANLKKEQIALLANAGITHLQPGIESFSNLQLQLMKKGTTFLQNIQTMKWCKEYGIDLSWNMLCGFPGENQDAYAHTEALIPFLTHLDPPGSCGIVRIDRFSPYFSDPGTFGIARIYPNESYAYIYPLTEEQITGLAYYFDFDYDFETPPSEAILPLAKRVAEWSTLSGKAALYLENTPEGIVLTDTRNINNPKTWKLNNIQSLIYLFCDKIQTEKAIIASLEAKETGIAAEDVPGMLNAFIKNKLMINDGDKYLSLAVQPEDRELYLRSKRTQFFEAGKKQLLKNAAVFLVE